MHQLPYQKRRLLTRRRKFACAAFIAIVVGSLVALLFGRDLLARVAMLALQRQCARNVDSRPDVPVFAQTVHYQFTERGGDMVPLDGLSDEWKNLLHANTDLVEYIPKSTLHPQNFRIGRLNQSWQRL